MKPDIKPLGIGDLMVVKQTLARYAAGEVAHIENVMATESRGREHRRLRRTEESFLVEEEITEENQRDLQTTERFELQQEVQKTIKQETKFEIGAEISAGFGPVKIGVNTSYSTSTSKTESDRKATEYAKEITDKSLSKIVERTRQERTTKSIEEFEEKNFHKFENAGGPNRTGVYRWVDKYYRVKVVNYGKRLFYEFLVPEPAALYVFARSHNIRVDLLPTEPMPPLRPGSDTVPLSPADIQPGNYLGLVHANGASGVAPPPKEFLRLTRVITRELQPNRHFAFTDSELEVPSGYVRVSHYATSSHWRVPDNYQYTVMHPGGRLSRDIDGTHQTSTDLQLDGLYPIGARGYGLSSIMVFVRITCQRTGTALNEWRLRTYQAIIDAYTKRRLAYEEQLAAAQIQGGAQIGGHNPLINRQIERDELKRACITLWTGYEYNGLAGIAHDVPDDGEAVVPKHFPRIHRANAAELRPEIKFVEQSFDWANMTYEFYPYYWGRRSQWLHNLSLSDNDPLFTDFLRAGSARVLVPVHPAATAQVLFYQLTGALHPTPDVPQLEPPQIGGALVAPGVEDNTDAELALYRDYMAELIADNAGDQLDKEPDISPGDPEAWLVKVPTTLVWLQPGPELPDLDNPGVDPAVPDGQEPGNG